MDLLEETMCGQHKNKWIQSKRQYERFDRIIFDLQITAVSKDHFPPPALLSLTQFV